MAFLEGEHRRHRVRVGARVADGADAAADARRQLFDFAQSEAYSRRFPFLVAGGAAARHRRPGAATYRRRTCAWSPPPRRCWRARPHTPRWCNCLRRLRAAARPGRLVQPRARIPHHRAKRVPDLARGRACHPGRHAVPAALPAVLAGQPGRAHVAGAGHHRRGAAAAVAHRAAALRVPHPLARVPLVWRSCAPSRTHAGAAPTSAELARDLDALEAAVARVNVPLSYADELYALRSNIDLVRGRLPIGCQASTAEPQNDKGRGDPALVPSVA